MKPDPGTYQTTFRVEKWEKKRKTPRVQYRTTFGGPVIDHNDILELVRELHASEDGQAHALVKVFRKAKAYDELNPLIKTAYITTNPGVKMNDLVCQMRKIVRTSDETGDKRIDDRVYCKDCERGVGCPDWDPPDGWCTAGIQSSEDTAEAEG